MTCGRLHHYASSTSSARDTTTSSTNPPAPEIQSIYEVESLRPISIHIEREPLGSWHTDLVTILLEFGKDPGQSPAASSLYSSSRHDTTMSSSIAPSEHTSPPGPLITGLHHINITIPDDTLELAKNFYAGTLGLTLRPVPAAQVHEIIWLDIGSSGQQVHISLPKYVGDTAPPDSSRHPCFKVGSLEALIELQKRIYSHWLRGGDDAPLSADAVGETSGPTTKEYPRRFFARDFAGNRLEFTV